MAFWRKDKHEDKKIRQQREVARRLKESQVEPRSTVGEQDSPSLSNKNRSR